MMWKNLSEGGSVDCGHRGRRRGRSRVVGRSFHRRGRRGRKGPARATEDVRDWAGFLLDVRCAILHNFDHVEILIGAGQVCRSWCRAARDVPELWRCIDMCGHADIDELDLCGMSQVAVRRSARRSGASSPRMKA